jgi:hypothetical protein
MGPRRPAQRAQVTARFIPAVRLTANSLEIEAEIMIFLDHRYKR